MKKKSVVIWIIIYWTFHAYLFAPQIYLLNLRSPSPFAWWQALVFTLVLFYLWAILTPFIFLVGKRFPLERRHFWRNLSILILFGIPAIGVHLSLFYLANYFLLSRMQESRSTVPIASLLVGFGATDALVYGGILTASQAILYFERFREREHSLSQAQLLALKTQLNPHFLFNTLNAISELVYLDAKKADRAVTKLSELLRMSLKSDQKQELRLEEEIYFLKIYLGIQELLLEERLKIEWQIASETMNAFVPNMILQPLVENSISHGIAPRREGGTVTIISEKQKNRLVLRVSDDGLGVNSKSKKGEGIGLSNIKNRLKHLYGDEHRFAFENSPEGKGVTVTLKIPFVEARTEDYEDSYFDY